MGDVFGRVEDQILFMNKIYEIAQFLKMSGNIELVEHSMEVAQIARMILKNIDVLKLKQDKSASRILEYVNLDILADIYELHDLGKIFIPDEILNKPARLNKYEFHYVYKHPENAKKVLDHEFPDNNLSKEISALYDTIMLISMEHHENYNGTGYPKGLKGEEISILGRIARVADVISALMGHRCYNREFNSFESISNYLVKNKGVLFDPYIVDIVTGNIKDKTKKAITKKRVLNVFDQKDEINKLVGKIDINGR